jgi:hypothetical protein
MATEMEKYANRARMWGLTAAGLTVGIWQMVEEASVSISPAVGEALLSMIEKQLGLELAGEKPDHMLTELGRIFVDEYGYCTEAIVEPSDKTYKITLKNAVGTVEAQQLKAMGITKPFSNPFVCSAVAALSRLGFKARGNMEIDVPNKTQIITLEIIG